MYDILELPDPKYKFKFMKPLTYFMRKPQFSDSETKVRYKLQNKSLKEMSLLRPRMRCCLTQP